MKTLVPNQTTATTGSPVIFHAKPFSLVEDVRARLGVTHEQMADYIGITNRTYQRRAQKGELDDAESAKVEMLSELLDQAGRIFEDDAEGRDWLVTPNPALDSQRPVDALKSVKGYEYVKNTLLQIEYGMF